MGNCFKRVEVDLDSDIEIANEILADFTDLKPKGRVIFRKDSHDVTAVIFELENWHDEHIRLNSIINY